MQQATHLTRSIGKRSILGISGHAGDEQKRKGTLSFMGNLSEADDRIFK